LGILAALIDAIQVCGRWVGNDLLRRLSVRAQAAEAPSRGVLVEEFCRALDWRDAKGRWCLSSARIALRRLEKRGKVQLPPQKARAQPSSPRALRDDAKPLPPLPSLPAHAGKIPGLRLRLIHSEEDPAHWTWNRLIARQHPQGSKPLVGAQLRYLVESDLGLIGAFGFGPAAYHLECRDQWIGWSAAAREANRTRVIGLSRFLIRPGLSCANLASCCYGLALRRVGVDWHQRYGIKPVLVETYVDRVRHQGRSLAAANWRRLGQSKGRGRDDPQRQRAQSFKDVWVYELDRKARALLQTRPLPILPACSVLAAAHDDAWAEKEMSAVQLGDQRLNQRVAGMLKARWERPGHSFYRSFDNAAQTKGAYRLVESDRLEMSLESLLAPHQQATARRMAAETVVLLAQDTSAISLNSLKQTAGLGSIGEDHSRGFFLHSLQAFRLDGIPLGTAWAQTWARPEQSDTAQRNEQSVDEKESGRWVRALQAADELARQMPRSRLIICGDRESDIYELYDQKQAAPANVELLVRAQHNRCLSDGTQLNAALAAAALGGTLSILVPRRQGRAARQALLELRWREVEIKPPAVALKKSWPALKIYALEAREVGAPKGVEPIHWRLLTSWPITSLKMARRIVRWYALRWGIECWHKVLKSVCGVERRQMKELPHHQRALALDMIVAWRVLLLVRMGKEHPNLSAELFYTPEELRILELKKKELPRHCATGQRKLNVLQANILVAKLAGFWARKSDGHPGPRLLAEGVRILQILVSYTESITSLKPARARRKPT
jgi:Druantia protein DruA/Transposase DNA-binding/Transposase Tn5 dimerisation domain